MSMQKQLLALQKQRADIVKGMETLVTTAEAEERGFNDEEKTQFASAKSELSLLDDRIGHVQETAKLIAENAQQVVPNDNLDPAERSGCGAPTVHTAPGKGTSPKRAEVVKGGFFARQAFYLYHAQGNQMIAADLAERSGEKEMGAVLRATAAAADTTTATWAAELVNQKVQDFIDLLRPRSVFSRVPSENDVSFADTNSIKMPRATTGTPGAYVAEGAAIPVKQGAFGSLTMTPSKMGVITVATRELFARSNPSVETILRNMMLNDTAVVQDRRFLSSLAAGSGAPSGLFHTDNAVAAIAASNTANVGDDAVADMEALLGAIFAANIPVGQLVWLMHSSKKLRLSNMRTAVGEFIFRDELAGGTLGGYPVIDSTVFDFGLNNGGASNIKTIALVDTSMLMKGFGIAPTVKLSEEATLHMDDAPSGNLGGAADPTPVRSMYQTDSIALRLMWENTWRTRMTAAVQHIDNVNW